MQAHWARYLCVLTSGFVENVARTLYEFFDLDWIRRCLRWDEARLAAWTRAARADWLELRDGSLLDFAVERARRDVELYEPADLVLRELVPQFVSSDRGKSGVLAAEAHWFDCGAPIVLGELATLFDVDLPAGASVAPALPIFDSAFAQTVARDPNDGAGIPAKPNVRDSYANWNNSSPPRGPLLVNDRARVQEIA